MKMMILRRCLLSFSKAYSLNFTYIHDNDNDINNDDNTVKKHHYTNTMMSIMILLLEVNDIVA